MDEYGNNEKKGLSGTAIVLIVVGVLVGLAVLGGLGMGVVYLWAASFTDDSGGTVDNLNLRASIDASEDTLELEVISGTVNWGEYQVKVDMQDVITLSTITSAGDTAVFTGAMWDPEPGIEYTVSIFNIMENRRILETHIIAQG